MIQRALFAIAFLVSQTCFAQENDPKSLELLKAIESNDLKLVKTLVKQGADVNFAIAVKSPSYDFFIDRLSSGTIPSQAPKRESVYISPMIAAAAAKNIEIVKFFFKKRANADAADSQGKTPLMYALRQPGGEEVALLFLKKGANYVVQDYSGNTALHYAAFGGNQEGIKMAIGGGLDINHRNQEGITPFMAAANHSDIKTMELLRSLGADPSMTDSSGMNAVHFAAAGNKAQNIRYLVGEVLLKPNLLSHDDYTALDLAAIRDAKEAIAVLSEMGSYYYTFRFLELLEAVKNEKFLKVDSLLKAGVNPNRIDPESPLHIAVRTGQVGMSQLILKKITDPGMKDKSGKTAFQTAIEAGEYKVAVGLFRQGVDLEKGDIPMLCSRLVNERPPSDMEAFHELMGKAIQPGVGVNEEYGPYSNSGLHYAALAADVFIFQKLIDQGANVNQANMNGWTPLHFLSVMFPPGKDEVARKALLEILLSKGADPNAVTTHDFSFSVSTNRYLFFPAGSNALEILDMQGQVFPSLRQSLVAAGLKPVLNAHAHTIAGKEYLRTKMFDFSTRELDIALRLDKNYADAWFQKGKLLQEQDFDRDAVKAFSEFLKLQPSSIEGRDERGTSRFESGDYAGAQEDFTEAIKLKPDAWVYYYYRGQAWLKLKQKDKACADFKAGKENGEARCTNSFSIHCK